MYAYFGVKGVGWETHDSLLDKRRSTPTADSLSSLPGSSQDTRGITPQE